MMKINVKHIAKLANLSVTEKEEEKFAEQLEAVLEHIAKLAEVDTKNIEETHSVTGLINVAREDMANESLSQEEAISNVHESHNGLVEVPVIIKEAIEE